MASKEENTLFAVGHLALGYILGRTSANSLKTHLVVPLLLVLTIIPDLDILFPGIPHRGPTHSIIVAFLVFIPFLILYGRKALPYFLALASHSVLSDYLVGGHIQLFWPLSSREFGLSGFYISITDPINVALELSLFLVATLILFKADDLYSLLSNQKENLILAIPIFTVLLPTFVGFPLEVPTMLVLPHLFYLLVFSASVLLVIIGIFRHTNSRTTKNLKEQVGFLFLNAPKPVKKT